jgi:hypothetical protein
MLEYPPLRPRELRHP